MSGSTSNDAAELFRIALLLQSRGEFSKAIELYNNVLAIEPDVPEVHNNLGIALLESGRLDDAVVSYRRALLIKPDFAAAYNNLGTAQRRMGLLPDALESYSHAVSFIPEFADAHNNIGNVLRDLGKSSEAILSYQTAIALRAEFIEAHSNLGNLLRDLGRLDEALVSHKKACECNPKIAEAYYNCGNVLLDLLRLDEAQSAYFQALKLKANYPRALVALARVMRLQARSVESEAACQRALAIEPNFADALSFLGELKTDTGDFEDALELFRKAVNYQPNLVAAWCGIARCRQIGYEDVQWREAANRLLRQRLPIQEEIALQYAIGKVLNDCSEFEQAFKHYRRANELSRRCGAPYDHGAFASEVTGIMNRFTPQEIARLRAFGAASECPVFIVGMPRSGTTLAEQILASHPHIFGAGELAFWGEAATCLASRPIQSVTSDEVAKLAQRYLTQLESLSGTSRRVVDKMPLNYLNLGLIHAALPRARIIVMNRTPRDVCLSIYFQNFSISHGYATDLNDIAHFYRQFRRIMNYWKVVLPEGVLMEVQYEGLVHNLGWWSQKIVEFIGLEWDTRCLEFHKTRRTVITPSRWQVRQQVGSSGVDRWRRYEQFIGPLAALAVE